MTAKNMGSKRSWHSILAYIYYLKTNLLSKMGDFSYSDNLTNKIKQTKHTKTENEKNDDLVTRIWDNHEHSLDTVKLLENSKK